MEMLQESPWRFYPLTLQFLSSKYTPLQAGGAAIPSHIRTFTAPPEQLLSALDDGDDDTSDEEVGIDEIRLLQLELYIEETVMPYDQESTHKPPSPDEDTQ